MYNGHLYADLQQGENAVIRHNITWHTNLGKQQKHVFRDLVYKSLSVFYVKAGSW